MAPPRWWRRRSTAPPPAFYEASPYADRLTLADAFAEDRETRATAEDRRVDHKPVGSALDAIVEAVAPARPSTRPSSSSAPRPA